MNKKAQVQDGINQLVFLAIGILVVGFIVGFGATFLADEQANVASELNRANCARNATAGTGGTIGYSNCTTEYNATQRSLEAMQDVGEGQGTVTTVGILAIVIALLLGVVALFGFMRGNQQ